MPPPPPVSLICIKSLMAFWSPEVLIKRVGQREHKVSTEMSDASGEAPERLQRLTDVVSTVADVGRYLVHTLTIQNRQVLGECTGQFLINGPNQRHIC